VPREPGGGAAVVITAMGARTAVGNDAVQTAAAVRAGINRFARWEALPDEFDGEAGVNAAFLPEDLGDAPWVAKAEDLAPMPIHEALWQAELYDFVAARQARPQLKLAAYVATPYPDRPGVSPDAYRLFAIEAREHCIAPARADQVHLISGEHAAGLIALARAVADLRSGAADIAVVGAVDSLLHGEFLRALAAAGRLKLPDRPTGLIPGEAAAVLVLERARDAQARGARPLGRLGAVAVDQEKIPLGPEHPIRAEAASRAVQSALQEGESGGAADIHRIIVDLTGERWRSLEWSLVETRCLGGMPRGWQLWHPADCLGDVGAAGGLVHVVLALRAFARGYGGPGGVLISAAAERGERAATCVFPVEEA